MVSVQIRVSGIPRTVQAMPNQNIGQFLSANGVDTTRSAVYLNGAPITPTTCGQTLAEAGITETALISSVQKTANA